ncbi:MAG: tetratricopeptide repeat protein [candidate division Zixibacteria bacterium]|nr:tetratricopeptide repeat protein [candidate division Zixibacteria bacterium]
MSESHSRYSLVIVVLATLYLCALAAPVTYPPSFWGINHLQYFDWSKRLLVLLGGIMLSVVLTMVVRQFRVSATVKRVALYGLAPLSLTCLFYFLHVRHHYLGDGVLRITQLDAGYMLLPTEPLGYLANVAVYRLARPLFHFTGAQAMEALSYISGVITYFAAPYFARTLCHSAEQRLTAFVLLMFSGVTLLYCGYAETYTLLPALLMFFFATGMRALQGRLSMLIPGSLYLLLVLFHFQFLYLMPSMLLLGYFEYQRKDRRAFTVSIISSLLSLAAAIVVPLLSASPAKSLGGFFMPFLPGNDAYWLFSTRHILEIVNELLLTAIAPLILLIAVLMSRPKVLTMSNGSTLFAIASLPGAFALLTLLHPSLGYPSDWDLFSSAGVIITICAITLYTTQNKFALNRAASLALGAVAIASFLAYAAVMADYDKAMARQVDILSISGEQGAYGFESIGTDLSRRNLPDQAEQMWKRSLKLRPHWRIYGNLSQLELNRGDADAAEYYALKALSLNTTNSVLYMTLGMAYLAQKRFQLAETNLRRACSITPSEPGFHHNLALCLGEQGRLAEAEVEARTAVSLGPGVARFLSGLGGILRDQGKYAESESVLLSGLKNNPENPELIANFAVLQKKTGHLDRAREILSSYMTAYPQNQNDSSIKSALQAVNRP